MARRILISIAPVVFFLVLGIWLEPIIGRLPMRILTWVALALGGGLYFKYAEEWGLAPGPYEPSVRELLQSDSSSEASGESTRKQ